MNKIYKLIKSLRFPNAVINGVFPSIEHFSVLRSLKKVKTAIDIGANKGQFALVVRYMFPKAKIISFEPLKKPANKFRNIFKSDNNVILYKNALGPKEEIVSMHVSQREDSSSLLPIGEKQEIIFPGTKELSLEEVLVGPLDLFVQSEDLVSPVLVKIDVQGFELEVLKGCNTYINNFDYIYVECSFVELYESQAMVDEVIKYLNNHSFKLNGVYNIYYDNNGLAIQGDFFFINQLKM